MKERKSVKLRVDMYDDTKSKIIDTMDERDLIQYIWIRLIVLAGKVNLEGELFLSRNIPYTMETLAIEFNRDIERVKLDMKVLMDLEMIEFTEDKIYKVKNFVKHQNIKINKNTEIKDSVVREDDSSHKRDEPKIKDRENLIGVDSKSSGYENVDEIVRNKTAKIEDKSIMIHKEEINEKNNININNCNTYNKDSTSVDSKFVVKGNAENESFANSNKNNSNIIIAERTQNSDTINDSIDSTKDKDDNENIECIDNTRNLDMITSNITCTNSNSNMNISLETEKGSCESNVTNAKSSIQISLKKKSSKVRKKSNNKNGINEINLNDEDEEIVELCSGDVLLGKDEKVVMAFSM